MSASPTAHDAEEISRFLGVLWRFNRALAQEVEPRLHRELDTDPRSFILLKSIHKGLQYPKLLAQELRIPSTLISRYLDDLCKRGLIERHIDERDSRRTRLTVTDKGVALIHDTEAVVHTLVGHRLARLDAEQLRTLNDAMNALTDETPCPEGTTA
ncbi:MarR family winged helix-turn-helix transcriptional regulator [Deinococcus maricopensis]|uniref:Regulatory protein MarR n=1 Tax=Deinococcus maricopensis (strain DSM 21211 / LMG 22137 / NRRL B-23946 / LB-34) TaxID=709986 RepID=E8U8K1_DEIML|nr:MarR family winged helix-turn-helix transcriptional regulator [Deinococcus maricopensis]ADV67390.1 regulatory protein MarR [Deinococcus maricopensis DSM 21211]